MREDIEEVAGTRRKAKSASFTGHGIWWLELMGSACLVASIYIVLFVGYHIVTAVTASYFGLDPIVYYNRIHYVDNTDWFSHAVKRSFAMGAIAMAALGVFSYILYALLRKSYIFLRLMLLWVSLISFALVAQRLIGMIFAHNFEFRRMANLGFELAIFSAYMYYERSTEWFMITMGLVLMITMGYFFAKPFLQTAWSSDQIGSETTRFNFLKYQVMLPYAIGFLIASLVMFPDNLVTNGVGFAAIGLCLVFAVVHSLLHGPMQIPQQKEWERWPIIPILLLIVSVVLLKTVFTNGLPIPPIGNAYR